MSTLHDTALDLHRQGVALIPCRPDKVATVKWSAYQTKLPAHDDLEAWFGFMATPEAGAIVAVLDGYRRAFETVDLEGRIATLEAQQEDKRR